MEVLIYQVLIAVLILVAGAFGKKSRNVITFIICLFTIIEVFTVKLAILQFITIFIAYAFSCGYEEKNIVKKKEEFNYYNYRKQNKENSESNFGNFSIYFIVVCSLFFTVYIFQKKNLLKKESVEIKKDSPSVGKSKKIFDPVQEEIAIDTVIDNDVKTDISDEDYLSNKINFLDYYNDEINNTEYCDHSDLSYEYDYTVFLKRNVNQEIDKIIVQIRNKSTKEILEKNISLIDVDGIRNSYLGSTFTNCNLVRSFITGHNIDKKPDDLDEGDFIVGDFNFDNKEDFAIKTNSGNNSGPSYGFYIKNSFDYELDSFLTNEVRFLPNEVDNVNKTIKTNIIVGCCGTRESIYKYISKGKKWVNIKSEYRKFN